ncbi:uncharacterized protein LOC129725675 [Wyeomyia smithii]|uniref:uncharacterized protein LOC129725675 n=1 Tax=Wyeomyia smithii TaxID=174621 RepID=UPI002467B324|nr:uncharacterized protein LOC129725675 [Wyeomyia smithii]
MKKFLTFLAILCTGTAIYTNKFEATVGCHQYDATGGYNAPHPYFSTKAFRNIETTTKNVTKLRLGVLARNDGHIRLAPVEYPFNDTKMNEIVLSGWGNTKIEVRRYTRQSHHTRSESQILLQQASNGLLSEFRPLMFTVEIQPNGIVSLTKDDDVDPLLQFTDTELSFRYIGFSNWDVPAIYFFDCPLEPERAACDGDF